MMKRKAEGEKIFILFRKLPLGYSPILIFAAKGKASRESFKKFFIIY